MRTNMNIDLNDVKLCSKFRKIAEIQDTYYYNDDSLNFIYNILEKYNIDEVKELIALNNHINNMINNFHNNVNDILMKKGDGLTYIRNLYNIYVIYNMYNLYFNYKIESCYNDDGDDDIILILCKENYDNEYISLKTLQLSYDELDDIISDNIKK